MTSEESHLILIVDDTPHNLQVAGEILSRENYKIALAQSGSDAMKFLEKRKPDLILLDIMMPDMDGFKVCQYLKENLETRFIPIIFLTARAQIEDIVKGFELGGADYLTKPFNDKELIARVKAQLELVKLQEMLRNKNRKLLDEIRLRKQREQDLIDYEKGRYVNALVGGIAHEFNNLLQIILGYGELVYKELEPNSELKDLQDSVLEAGHKAAKIVEQLMFFADRRQQKNFDRIELLRFFEDRVSLFRGIFHEDMQFEFQLPSKPLIIMGDPAELAQVMVNIFLNSCEALEKSGKIIVRVEEYTADEKFAFKHRSHSGMQFALIEVSDNGRGMGDEQLKKVFDPFVTFHQQNGVGLGLSVVKAVVKRLGGFVEMTSKPQEGTTCSLFIPLSENHANSSSFFKFNPERESQPGNGELILLAEDEENILFLEKKILEREGYRVLEAKNGNEAVELFLQNADEISLVLLDIGMPIKSGIQAGKEIEALGFGVPIAYCTAYTDKRFEEIADRGCILQKPFKRNEIVSLIQESIQQKI